MTHNPFVEPYKGFFERGGRKTYLEQLRHLSEWSRRVLLVTGPEGVGKSSLYRELAATLEPRVKAARINAGLVNTGREVLSAIAQGFGLAVVANANTQALSMSLIQHVDDLATADRLCLVLVDDAHLLDNKAVDELAGLAHESAMHLVLFGEVRMVPVIERAASSKGIGWQEIRLSGYGDADARDYLEWRFSQARYRGRIPFTVQEVKDLVRLSEGLPGRMNQMANVLLVKLETGQSAEPRGGFPRLHVALLALVVMLVGLLYVVLLDDDLPADQQAPLELAVRPAAAAGTPESEASESVIRTNENSAAPANNFNETGSIEREPVEVVQPPAELGDAAALPVELSESGEVDASLMPPVAVTAPASEVPVEQEPEPVSVPAPEAKPEPEPEPESESVPEAAAEEQVSEVSTVSTNEPHDRRWLMSQEPNYFTLQLVTVSSQERAAAFVERQLEPREYTIYPLSRDGRILHVVLYGLFTSREAAQRGADRLPAGVGDIQPWIRQIGQVQDAARIATLQ